MGKGFEKINVGDFIQLGKDKFGMVTNKGQDHIRAHTVKGNTVRYGIREGQVSPAFTNERFSKTRLIGVKRIPTQEVMRALFEKKVRTFTV